MPRFMGGWAAPLVDPIACPGMFDLLAIIASRTWRDVPLSSILAAGDAVILVLALLLLARTVHAITSTIVITIAITLAAGASGEFARVLAPSAVAPFLLTMAAWTAILRAHRLGQDGTRIGVPLGLLALLAATAPPFTVPVMIVAGWLARKRGWIRAGLAAIVVLAPSAIVQLALAQGPSSSGAGHLLACVIPPGGVAALIEGGGTLGAVLTASPVVTALAVLGLLMRRRLAGDVARSLLPLAVVAFWCVAVLPEQSAGMAAPFVIVYWLLVAAGLAEVWEATSRTSGGKAGAVALSIALVALQIAAASPRRNTIGPADGHERLTVAMMTAIVGALPRGAGLVAEDAATDLLTRALPSRLRTPDRFHVVRRDATAVADALKNAPVFALPRSQRALQHMGFELADATSAGFAGLAEIRAQHACTPELGEAPIPLPLLTGRQAFALVAGHERSHDRIVIVLAGDAPVSVSTVNWPPAAMRGIQGRMFDLTVAADQRDLGEELRSYGLPSWSAPGVRYVTRIEAWRTPGAPLVLPVTLGGAVVEAAARRLGAGADQQLRLCPSIPYDVRPLGLR